MKLADLGVTDEWVLLVSSLSGERCDGLRSKRYSVSIVIDVVEIGLAC